MAKGALWKNACRAMWTRKEGRNERDCEGRGRGEAGMVGTKEMMEDFESQAVES